VYTLPELLPVESGATRAVAVIMMLLPVLLLYYHYVLYVTCPSADII